MPIRTTFIVFLAVAVLCGCGRRGPLEDPPPKPVVAKPLDAAQAPPPPPVPRKPLQQRSFMLDFLI